MIKLTEKQDALLYSTIHLLIKSVPPRVTVQVLADLMAELLHDSSPDQVNALLAADELNHRIKQRLQALAEDPR
ncbi:hypothetical protein [Roseibium album]|uniref:hypothetical protein n=1 Tax=Roseibium album TaxID=311410 RepID=UPI002491CD43|nr:hypothetical protein [Roseibium album]